MLLRLDIVLIVCLMFFSLHVCAQKPVFDTDTAEKIHTANVPLNEISIRAVRHFGKHYPNIHDEQWAPTIKGGYVATFTIDSKICRIYYGEKGDFRLSSITYSGRKNFPEELKRLVRIGYPDSAIENVVELSNGTDLLYGITISDKQTFRLIEYCQNETKVVEEYIKQM